MRAKSSISAASNHTRRPAAVSASAMCCGRSPSFQAWLRKMSYSANTRSGSSAKRRIPLVCDKVCRPYGTRRNFTSYPALRLRLRAGLNSFAPDGAGFSSRTRYWQIPHLSCIQILTSQAQSVPPCWLLFRPVGIYQDLAGLAGLEQFHARREVLHCYAIRDHGMQVELVGLEQRGHLVPGLVHAAAVDALHGCAFEDDFFREVEFDWLGGNPEKGHAATETQDLEACSDGFGPSGHLQHDVDASAAGVVHHDL